MCAERCARLPCKHVERSCLRCASSADAGARGIGCGRALRLGARLHTMRELGAGQCTTPAKHTSCWLRGHAKMAGARVQGCTGLRTLMHCRTAAHHVKCSIVPLPPWRRSCLRHSPRSHILGVYKFLNRTHIAKFHSASGQLFWFSGKCVYVQKMQKRKCKNINQSKTQLTIVYTSHACLWNINQSKT
jgi:hypothetical protein